jgi:pimeloyl-ACP methyl ester carboxylesterase
MTGNDKSTHVLPPFDRYPLQSIVANDHRTTYLRHGQGPALVLLHGYAGAIWNWEHQIAELGKHFTLYVPDLLGHGLSDKPRLAYNPRLYLDWLVAFLDALGIQQADFIGHSMGCGLAMALAITHPDRVARLAMISGFPPRVLDSVQGRHLRFFARLGAGFVFAAAYRLMTRKMFNKALQGVIYDSRQITPEVVDRAYRLHKAHGRAWPLWSLLSHVPAWERDFSPKLPELTTPSLVVWGDKDRFMLPEVGRVLHQTIRGSKFVVIPDAGHFPMWERPDEVNRLVLEFLSR